MDVIIRFHFILIGLSNFNNSGHFKPCGRYTETGTLHTTKRWECRWHTVTLESNAVTPIELGNVYSKTQQVHF